ncbi:MAG: tetratricopeptide repeat protein [Bacteroidetes bacterium]|nr:tetratricopeptide repeat protein [Bacteroidota bacterium]MBU2508443.1 tetratricopeptide repeat protein [Bacteroidota bacterium]
MKFKTIYIYGMLAVVILSIVIVSSISKEEQTQTEEANVHGNMPQDDIHGGLNMGGDVPSKSNVKSDFMDRFNEAKASYEQSPNDTLKMREYADLLLTAHKKDLALELYNKILAVDSKRVDAYLALGLIHYQNGKFDKAEASTKKILKLDADNSEANYNLGAIAIAQGDTAKAKQIWENLVKKYPNTETAQFTQESLKKLAGK